MKPISKSGLAKFITKVTNYNVFELMAIKLHNDGYTFETFQKDFVYADTKIEDKIPYIAAVNIASCLKDIEHGILKTTNAPNITL